MAASAPPIPIATVVETAAGAAAAPPVVVVDLEHERLLQKRQKDAIEAAAQHQRELREAEHRENMAYLKKQHEERLEHQRAELHDRNPDAHAKWQAAVLLEAKVRHDEELMKSTLWRGDMLLMVQRFSKLSLAASAALY